MNPTTTAAWKQLVCKCRSCRQGASARLVLKAMQAVSNAIPSTHAASTWITRRTVSTTGTMAALFALYDECNVADHQKKMFSGEKINNTEKRAVLHTALRNLSDRAVLVRRQGRHARRARGSRPCSRVLPPRSQRRMEGLYRRNHHRYCEHRYRRLRPRPADDLRSP